MKDVQYFIAKVISKLKREKNKETIISFFRKQGIRIGEGANIGCNIITPEPYLIDIGENVTISSEVVFITHDNSIMKVDPKCINLAGIIRVGDNCFIGERSVLLYGVSLANNIIVAAGSVVANSFEEERIIIAGNPARKISTWDDFYSRHSKMAMKKAEIYEAYKSDQSKLIKKKVKNGKIS